MSYETRLAELVHEPVLTQLEGQGGLLALTGRELWLLDEQGQQHAPLTRIRRITRGEGGTVVILGETDTLMTVPLRSFQVDELKMFLESLKEHVIRARKGISTAVENPPAAPVEPAPAEAAPLEPMPEPVAISQAGPEPMNTPEPTPAEPVIPRSYIEEPEEVPVTPTVEQAPARSPVWEEAPSPRAEASTQVWAESPAAAPLEEVAVSPTLAPPMASAPARRGGTSTLLKLMSLITLGATLAYLVNQILTPSGDIWGLVGVAVVGSGLALIEWRLSE
ncbi:MAG TPA: hypothetical protein VFS50_17790 [Meiothermus sp.]|nr:hypothetical protein [Meiothermus sp.]